MDTRTIDNALLFGEIEHLLAGGKTVTITTKGESMAPFLIDNCDKVVLEPLPSDKFKKGMIVIAQLPNKNYVMHRIVAISKTITLMGDNNNSQEIITPDDIVGYISSKISQNGEVVNYGSLTWNWFAFWALVTKQNRTTCTKIYTSINRFFKRIKKRIHV